MSMKNEADCKGKDMMFFCETGLYYDTVIKVGITTERDFRGRLSDAQYCSVHDVTCEGFDYCIDVNDAEDKRSEVKEKFGVIVPGSNYMEDTPELRRYINENCKTGKHVKWAIRRSKRLRNKYDRNRPRR